MVVYSRNCLRLLFHSHSGGKAFEMGRYVVGGWCRGDVRQWYILRINEKGVDDS